MRPNIKDLVNNKEVDDNLLPIIPNSLLNDVVSPKGELPSTDSDVGYGFNRPGYNLGIFKSQLTKDQQDDIYIKSEIPYITKEDWNEIAARDQGTFKLGPIGFLRTQGKMLAEIAKVPGMVGGAGAWLAGLPFGATSTDDIGLIFDNAYNRGVDDIFNSVFEDDDAALKIHVPKKVKEGSLLDNLKSSEFWATEGADAQGFMLAMLAPGAFLKATKAAKGITGIASKFKTIKDLGKFERITDNVLSAAVNTIAEAGAEGSGAFTNIRDGLLAKGVDPYVATKMASDKAASVFNANFGILLVPNMLQDKFFFGRFSPKATNMISEVYQTGKKIEGFAKPFRYLGASAFRKDLGKKFATGVFSEGIFEEGMQSSVENYFTHKGLNQDKDETGFWNEVKSGGEDILGTLKTYAKGFTTDVNMQKSMVLGGMLGGLGGSLGAYRNYKQAQHTVFGHEGPKSKVGKWLSETKLGGIFVDKERKSFKDLIDESAIKAMPGTLSAAIETDANGKYKLKEDATDFLYNPNSLMLLGSDLSKDITTDKIITDASEKQDEESVNKHLKHAEFNILRPFLESEETVDFAKNTFLPKEAETMIRTLEKYRNNLSQEQADALTPEFINKRKDELSKRLDEFKKIYDEVNQREDYDVKVKYDPKYKTEYNNFLKLVRSAKLEQKINNHFAKERIKDLEDKNAKIFSDNPFTSKNEQGFKLALSDLKAGDIVKYKGEDYAYFGNGKLKNLVTTKDVTLGKEDFGESSTIEKLDATVDLTKQVYDNYKGIRFNKNTEKKSKEAINTLYDNKEVQTGWDTTIKKLESQKKKVAFLTTIKPGSKWRNKTTGDEFMAKDIDGEMVFFKKTINEKGRPEYVIEANEKDIKPEDFDTAKFSESYEEVLPVPAELPLTKDEETLKKENIARINKVIAQIEAKENVSKTELEAVEEDFNEKNAMLPQLTEEVKESNLELDQQLVNLQETLSKKKRPASNKKLIGEIDAIKKRQAAQTQVLANFAEQVRKLEEQKSEIDKKISELQDRKSFYTNLLKNENYKIFSSQELKDHIKRNETLIEKLKKVADAIVALINKVKGLMQMGVESQGDPIAVVDNLQKEIKYINDLITDIQNNINAGLKAKKEAEKKAKEKEKAKTTKTTTKVKKEVTKKESPEKSKKTQKEVDDELIDEILEDEGIESQEDYEDFQRFLAENPTAEDGIDKSDLEEEGKEINKEKDDLEREGIERPEKLSYKPGDVLTNLDTGEKKVVKSFDPITGEIVFEGEEKISSITPKNPVSETSEQDTNPELVAGTKGLRRSLFDAYDGTANNRFVGTTSEEKGDLNSMAANKVASDFNIYNGDYQLMPIVVADMFPEMEEYFKQYSPDYEFDEYIIVVLTDKKGNLIGLNKDWTELETVGSVDNIGNFKGQEKPFVFWSLREATNTYKSTGLKIYFEPDIDNQLEYYYNMFPGELENVGKDAKTKEEKLNEVKNRATALFQQAEKKLLEEHEQVRNNIKESSAKGEQIFIDIKGHSAGIVNSYAEQFRPIAEALKELEIETPMSQLEIRVATSNLVSFEKSNNIPASPGRTYVYDHSTGHIFETQPRKLTSQEVGNIVGLFHNYEYHINRIMKEKKKTFSQLTPEDFKEAEKFFLSETEMLTSSKANSLFAYLSDIIHYDYIAYSEPYKGRGRTISLKERGFSGPVKTTPINIFVVNKDKTVSLNPKLMAEVEISPNETGTYLQKTLMANYHKVKNVKVKSTTEDMLLITSVNPKNGTIKVKSVPYAKYLLTEVLRSNIAKPGLTTTQLRPGFSSTEKQYQAPLFENMYIKMDLEPLKKGFPKINKPSDGKYRDQFEDEEVNAFDALNALEDEQESIDSEIDTYEVEDGFRHLARGKKLEDLPIKLQQELFSLRGWEILKGMKNQLTKEQMTLVKDILAPFRKTKGITTYQTENFSEFNDWFTTNFPQFGEEGIHIVEGLQEQGVFGYVANNAIYLDNQAELGTGYHEAFHITSHYLLNPKEIQSLYKEWRSRNKNKSFTTDKGETKLAQDFTDQEVEEQLAEDFRDYKLSNGVSKYAPIQDNIFSKIWRWIKEFFTQPSIHSTFMRMDTGYYGKRTMRPNSRISHRTTRYFNSDNPVQRSPEFYKEVMEATNTFFFDHIRKVEGSFDIFFNKDDNNELINDAYIAVKNEFEALRKDAFEYINDLESRDRLTTAEKTKLNRNKKRLEHYDYILDQFKTPKNFRDFKEKHAQELMEYGLASTISESNVEYDSDSEYDEDTLNKTFNTDETVSDIAHNQSDVSIKVNSKYNAQKTIKLLVGSLPELVYDKNTKSYKRAVNPILLTPKTVKFGVMFNLILAHTSGSKSVEEMIYKLKTLKEDVPSLEYFFSDEGLMLDKVLEGDLDIPKNKFNEILQLTQTFAKTQNKFTVDIINKNGKRDHMDANSQSQRKGILLQWRNNSKAISLDPRNNKIKNDQYNTEAFNSVSIPNGNINAAYDFLSSIGMEFTDKNRIRDLGKNDTIIDLAQNLLKAIKKDGQVNVFSTSQSTNYGGFLNTLIDIEYKSNMDLNVMSHSGMDGQNIYDHTLNSYISNIIDTFNKFDTWKEMITVFPHLNTETNSWLGSSVLLKKGGLIFDEDGYRKKNTQIILHTNEGISESETDTQIEYSKLSKADRMASVQDRAFKGFFNLLRPADKSLERFITIGNEKESRPIRVTDYLDYFTGYLKDDIYEYRNVKNNPTQWKNLDKNTLQNGGIFIQIIKQYGTSPTFLKKFEEFMNSNLPIEKFLENKFNSEMMEAAFNNYLNQKKTKLLQWAIQNEIIEQVNDNTFKTKGITLSPTTNLFSEIEILSHMKDFLIADTVMNMEQLKMIFGNPNYYKAVADFFKRTGSFPGTKKLLVDDHITNQFILEKMKRTDMAEGLTDTFEKGGAKIFSYDKNKDGYKSIVRQIVFQDPSVVDEIFGKIEEETDGYSMISLDAYREMIYRAGDWTFGENSHEDLYQWEMQRFYGPRIGEPGFLTKEEYKSIFNTTWDGAVRDPENIHRIIEKAPSKKINMLKPLHVGQYAEKGFVPGITKTSFAIIYPSATENKPNMAEMMQFMRKNKISVVSFASANKGITTKLNKDGSFNQLYVKDENGNGVLNLKNLELYGENANAVYQDTYTENWGIQLDTGFKNKHGVIYGTQMMKLILSYLYSNGQLNEDKYEGIKELTDSYLNLNAERLSLGKQKLLKELDIKEKVVTKDNGETTKEYVIDDYDKFKERLKKIADARNMDDNAYNSINFIEGTLGMDILITREKFEAAIFSLNDAMVIKQKRTGGSYYQQPHVLHEAFENEDGDISGIRTYDQASGTLKASENLKAYGVERDADGKITKVNSMQVKLPYYFKGIPKKDLDKILREGIAFRIPTQGLASIDAIEVVEFLPESEGDTVVLPSMIVKKAGSDYDIDKLNIYLPYVYYDENNNIKYIDYNMDYSTYEESFNKKLGKYFSGSLWKTLNQEDQSFVKQMMNEILRELQLLKDESIYDIKDIILKKIDQRIVNLQNPIQKQIAKDLKKLITVVNKDTSDKLDSKLTREDFRLQQVENKILSIQREIVLHPSNHENLIKSLDDTKGVITNLVNEIFKLKTGNERDKGDLLSLIDRISLVDVADRFLSSKQAVGITALFSTFHVLAQMSDLRVSPTDHNGTSTKINMEHNHNSKGEILLGGELDTQKNNISDILRQWISEAVDAAKDPRMFDLNVNLETLSTTLYLTMAGVPTDTLMYFMNQPIIVDYLQIKSAGKSAIKASHQIPKLDKKGRIMKKKGTDEVIMRSETLTEKEIIAKTKAKYGGNEEAKESKLSNSKLQSNIKLGKKINITELEVLDRIPGVSAEFKQEQVRILNDFLRYKEMAGVITDAIQGVTWDTKSAGRSIPELILRGRSTENALTLKSKVSQTIVKDGQTNTTLTEGPNVLINYDKILSTEKSFIGAYYKNNMDLLDEFSPIFKVVSSDSDFRNILEYFINRFELEFGISNDEKIKILNSLIPSYLTYRLLTTKNSNLINYKSDLDTVNLSYEEQYTIVGETEKLFSGPKSVAKKLHMLQEIIIDFNKFSKGEMTEDEVRRKNAYRKDANGNMVFNEELYRRLIAFYSKYRSNEFFNSLIPNISSEEDYYDHVVLPNRSRDLLESSILVDGFNSLLNETLYISEPGDLQELGLGLVKLVIKQEGLQNSPSNFINFVDAKLYTDLMKVGWNGRYKEQEANQNDLFKFFMEYHMENFRNANVVPLESEGYRKSAMYPILKGPQSFKPELKKKFTIDQLMEMRRQGKSVTIPLPLLLARFSGQRLNNQLKYKFYKDFTRGRTMTAFGSLKTEALTGSDQNKNSIFVENFNKQDFSVEDNSFLNQEYKYGILFQQDNESGYVSRTKKNASADATLSFSVNFESSGEILTKKFANIPERGERFIEMRMTQNKKYFDSDLESIINHENELILKAVQKLNLLQAKSINIAGNSLITFKKTTPEYSQKFIDETVYVCLKAIVTHPLLENKNITVRTGGQSGSDEAGAKAAVRLGLPTKILSPKGFVFTNETGQTVSNEKQFKDRFKNLASTATPIQITDEQLTNINNLMSQVGFKELTKEEFNKLTVSQQEKILECYG